MGVSFSLINRDVRLANVREIPAFVFIYLFRSSVAGPEKKILFQRVLRFGRDVNSQTLRKDWLMIVQMINMFCLFRHYFRSSQKVLQKRFPILFQLFNMEYIHSLLLWYPLFFLCEISNVLQLNWSMYIYTEYLFVAFATRVQFSYIFAMQI